MLLLAVLLLIFVQDIISRSVYWIAFPLLAVLLVVFRLLNLQRIPVITETVLVNTGFLLFQFLLVSAWFSFKQGKWTNITMGLLGWGDILFLVCISLYLSVANFLLFYISSLIAVLLTWLGYQLVAKSKDLKIPLAGLQALFFIAILLFTWWWIPYDLTSDDWLVNNFWR